MASGAPVVLFLDPAPETGAESPAFAGVRRYAAARGWKAQVVMRPAPRRKDVAALLASHPSAVGCVVECSDDAPPPPLRHFGGVPVVYLHAAKPPGGGAPCLSTDAEAVAKAAFRELSAGRPAAFAVVDYGRPRLWAKARVAAFRDICRREGRRCYVFSQREEPDAERRARRVEFLRSLPRRTAVFAVNDAMARGVAEDARVAMRPIPFDLTLLGVDNEVAICEKSNPPISSIQIDHERAGFAAARIIGEMRGIVRKSEIADHPQIAVLPLLAVRRRSTGGHGRRANFVAEAVEIIRREACNGLSADSLAARFDCSRALFDLRFREAMGHSAYDEILHVRLAMVDTYLTRTTTALRAIAGLCGFDSDHALRCLFRRRFGMSMREWRKNRRGNENNW